MRFGQVTVEVGKLAAVRIEHAKPRCDDNVHPAELGNHGSPRTAAIISLHEADRPPAVRIGRHQR